MKHLIAAAFAGTAAVCLASQGFSQELGNVKRGQNLAETVCAECHAVERDAPRSPNGSAPTFVTLATTPGMTSMALRVALRTSHTKMPNLVLKNHEVDDVIAYLATLK